MKIVDAELLRIIGKEIRLRRKALGWSQEKLAEKADLNPKYLSEIERARPNPSVATLYRIAVALKTSPNDLLDFSPSGERTPDPRVLFEKLLDSLKGKPKLQMELLKRLLDETAKLLK